MEEIHFSINTTWRASQNASDTRACKIVGSHRPCSVGLTPEEWTLVLEMPATCTEDNAITIEYTARIQPDGSLRWEGRQ